MTTTPLPHACIVGLADDHRIIRSHLLPHLATAVWDLERHHAAGDEELAALRGEIDELLLELRQRLTRHDRAELDELFPAAEEAIHQRLVERDRAEDRARGWEGV